MYRGGLDPKPAYELTATSQVQATAATPVLGLSTDYVPIKVASDAGAIAVQVTNGFGPAPSVSLIVGGPGGRAVTGKVSAGGRKILFATAFRSAAERDDVMLIVTSGRQDGVAYKVAYLAR